MSHSKTSSILLILFSLAITFSCSNSSSKKADTTQDSDPAAVQGSTVLIAYYELKDALVSSNNSLTKEKATFLVSALKKEHHNDTLIVAAEAMASSDDIENQRMEFEKLSEAIYKQYCPMAFGNKGAFWLSNKKEIMNPYFGDKMLHCGKVEETITKL